MTRRLLALVLVLGLAPGVAGGLLEGAARCSHACCRGQESCHRGAGHDHDMAGDHVDHHSLAVTAIEPPSASCLETCGVLTGSRPKTEDGSRAKGLDPAQTKRPAPPPFILAAETATRVEFTSPRGPPR